MAQVQYHMLYDVAKQNDSIVKGCMLVLKIIKHYLNNFLTKVMKLFYVKINVATCIKNVVANVMIFNQKTIENECCKGSKCSWIVFLVDQIYVT